MSAAVEGPFKRTRRAAGLGAAGAAPSLLPTVPEHQTLDVLEGEPARGGAAVAGAQAALALALGWAQQLWAAPTPLAAGTASLRSGHGHLLPPAKPEALLAALRLFEEADAEAAAAGPTPALLPTEVSWPCLPIVTPQGLVPHFVQPERRGTADYRGGCRRRAARHARFFKPCRGTAPICSHLRPSCPAYLPARRPRAAHHGQARQQGRGGVRRRLGRCSAHGRPPASNNLQQALGGRSRAPK